MELYDDLVMGAGMGGLTVAALLAQSGRRVLVLEAHDTPGGYAHTFSMGEYNFCAQVHYIFHCGEGEPVNRVLRQLGLHEEITFRRLDPEGFEHVVIGRERFRIPNGLAKSRDRLIHRFPDAKAPLRRYFAVLMALRDETSQLPDDVRLRDLVTAPLRFPHLLRYRTWTLQRFYDHVKMPQHLQAVLAGQSGDYLLPPEQVSFLLHAALVNNYDSGAYYPDKHFGHMVASLAERVRSAKGCQILLNHEVTGVDVSHGRVVGVRTLGGKSFRARRYISNIDPALTMRLLTGAVPSRRYRDKLSYEYSSSTFTMYLGLKNIDLRDYGFGSHNVWYYPHDDLNRIYRDQNERDELSEPWLFLSTPTLHSELPGVAPLGHQVLEVATSCRYEYFAELRRRGQAEYSREKKRIRERILDVISERFIPNVRQCFAMRVAGTPLTNEEYCRAPYGNSYGSALTPRNMWPRIDYRTPFENLFLVNATAGYPSVAGTISAGARLFERLRSS